MATTPPFKYQPMFEKGKDTTEYYLLTKDYVSVSEFEGKPILKIEKEGLTAMANAAFRDVSFMLRRSHNEQVAKILSDPEASDNDKYVALTFLRNAEVASKGVLPFCQDTGTAIIHGEKGQQVWTGYCDEEALSLGVYKTYTEENLRYSQNAPLTMYDEVNTKCNLPAQIDIEATEGMEYEFLCVTKGGGSANKTYLYQETKAILNPETLVPFLISKIKTLGTAACPPYHIAFVIGGTSAEKNLLTVKLASTHFYDNLPTTGNEFGRAFRDVELEKLVLEEAHKIGLGAQFGGFDVIHARCPGIFSRYEQQVFERSECPDRLALVFDLFHREDHAVEFVMMVESAVDAGVRARVGDIHRNIHRNSLAEPFLCVSAAQPGHRFQVGGRCR